MVTYFSFSLSLFRPTVCGSPQLPAAALDNLVREPLRPAGTDGSYQVSGGSGRGLGPSVPCHRLLDCTLQQGTGFSTSVSSVVGVPCPLRMKKEKASYLRLLSVLPWMLIDSRIWILLFNDWISSKKGWKEFGTSGIDHICRHIILRLLR